jgi:acetolactate synthase-1/3 small subunit
VADNKKHTISVLVENHFGVLARVSGMFSARGYNIDSLCVGETENPAISRMTVVVGGDERVLHQIVRQLNKLVEVIEVTDLTAESYIERELVLIKVAATAQQRGEIIEIANIFRAKVVDVGKQSLVVEVTGAQGKVEAFIDMMRSYGILELVRTGKIALKRSER